MPRPNPQYVQPYLEDLHPEEEHGVSTWEPENTQKCINPKCRRVFDQQDLQDLDQFDGHYTCPDCDHSYNYYDQFERPGGKTRAGLTLDQMGYIGEQVVASMKEIPGLGEIVEYMPGKHGDIDFLIGAYGCEVKTNHSEAQPRFKIGGERKLDPDTGKYVSSRQMKYKFCQQNNLIPALIGVRLNFYTDQADVFVRKGSHAFDTEGFNDSWIGSSKLQYVGTVDFSELNPFRHPEDIPPASELPSDEDEEMQKTAGRFDQITNPKIHVFDEQYIDSAVVYDITQTDDSIKDGDVLVVPWEQVVGILVKAWPVAITAEPGDFHSPNLPNASQQLIPDARGYWETLDDGIYLKSYQLAVQEAEKLGYKLASKTGLDEKIAKWPDVQQKAKRLLDSGNVTIYNNGYNQVAGSVKGDHGTYGSPEDPIEFYQNSPEDRSITYWKCQCPWGEVSWGRTRQWKKYEGRVCSHILALYWSSRQQAYDQGYSEDQGPPNNPVTPPETPQGGGNEFMEPIPEDMPQYPMDQPEQPPSQETNEQPSQTNMKPPSVDHLMDPIVQTKPVGPGENPLAFPGSFSHWKESMAERTGDPQLDTLIEQFKSIENLSEHPQTGSTYPHYPDPDPTALYRDPEYAAGNCGHIAQTFERFLERNGISYEEWPDRPAEGWGYHDKSGPFANDYEGHTATVVYLPNGIYMIDWTAAQYGYSEFPMVQRLDDHDGWQRHWRESMADIDDYDAGLLYRSPEENIGHDYHPSWDKEQNEAVDPATQAQIAAICQAIYERDKIPFECWACHLPEGTVAEYVNGTGSYPVVLIDIDAHRGYEDQFGQSIEHELRHGVQDFEGRDFDEDDAEHGWTNSARKFAAKFQNGDTVRVVPGAVLIGFDRDGEKHSIPESSSGEILYCDDQEVVVIFPLEGSYLTPHLVKVFTTPDSLYSDKGGTPFVKRRGSGDEGEKTTHSLWGDT